MRYARVLTALTLLTAVGLATVALARGSHPQRPSSSAWLRSAVQQMTRQFPPGHPRPVAPSVISGIAPANPGTACFVAAGSCSIKPCVIPVRSAPNVAVGRGTGCPLGDRVPKAVPIGARVAGR